MSSNSLNGAQVIVDYLIQEKVPQVFGLYGHGNIQFIDALYEQSSDIKTISVHHESVAGFMADVYYRVSGWPTPTFTSEKPSRTSSLVSASPVMPLTRTAWRTRTASNQPQRRKFGGHGASVVRDKVLAALDTFTQGAEREDDLTVLVLCMP